MKKANDKIQKLQIRIDHELRISPSISHDLKEQASKYAYWAAAHALKLSEYQTVKNTLNVLEARLSKVVEQNLLELKKTDSRIRMSDKLVKNNAIMDNEYILMQERLVTTGLEEGILGAAKEAMRQRGQMILEIARMERTELSQPEYVMTRQLIKEQEKA